MRKSLRHYGYQSFEGGGGEYGHPTYEEAGGKIATVTSVIWEEDKRFPSLSTWRVNVTIEETGRVYTAKAMVLGTDKGFATIDGIALLRDLESARKLYLGRKFWIMQKELTALNDEENFSSVKFRMFQGVTVSDVLAGDSSSDPVRFVVKNETGQEGYFDIALTSTNLSETLAEYSGDSALARILLAHDPKVEHKWSARVWHAIEESKVFVGMTKQQAEMGWGKPSSVNRTIYSGHVHEQWVYDGSYLYFEDGMLTSIQN